MLADELYGNVNTVALDASADAIAHAAVTYAFDTSSVNGETSPGKSHGKAKGGKGGKGGPHAQHERVAS